MVCFMDSMSVSIAKQAVNTGFEKPGREKLVVFPSLLDKGHIEQQPPVQKQSFAEKSASWLLELVDNVTDPAEVCLLANAAVSMAIDELIAIELAVVA
jgi:hypothetical protein